MDTVLTWANDELRALSPAGWALGGASAGGTLTAGCAVRLRDRGVAAPARLVLVYPLLHPLLPAASAELTGRLAEAPPVPGISLTPDVVALITLNYVDQKAEALQGPYAFAGGHDLAGLPATLIINADMDTIRASGEAFAAELDAAGVDVVTVTEGGTAHGHLDEPSSPGAVRTTERILTWIATPRDGQRDRVTGHTQL